MWVLPAHANDIPLKTSKAFFVEALEKFGIGLSIDQSLITTSRFHELIVRAIDIDTANKIAGAEEAVIALSLSSIDLECVVSVLANGEYSESVFK
ncbi:hypothetical protein D3C71_1291030 [compost metagenome]